ncbi:TonB-dependent receptor domain-containing protein [Rhizorhabdus sp. FW153]|uniref:TonB-dependent receptor domain-containing protein n=1 Tax=Rhizorhabdus sp. FW153 TaxID=3400216 RepID=UPI003CF574BC
MVAGGPVYGQQIRFDLPAGKATETLPLFALQSGLQIVASSRSLASMQTPELRGVHDAREALARMISGSTLTIASDRNNVITLRERAMNPKPGGATARAAKAARSSSAKLAGRRDRFIKSLPTETSRSEIIVTGTRIIGTQVAESATPIQSLAADVLGRTGQPNLNLSLAQAIPSFTAQSKGGDMANFSLSGRLRGLNPNHVLVMVNGKRRHNSALLQTSIGPFQGSAAPNIDLIPPDAVSRVEMLLDGAAAQYGSDAIAGVINIILKDDPAGGEARTSYGQYFDGEGTTLSTSVNYGFPINDAGFANLTLFHRRIGQTYQGEGQTAVTDVRTGAIYPTLRGDAEKWARLNLANINRGAPKSSLAIGMVNMGYDLGGVTLYVFGDVARRVGSANQNYRHPARICTISTIGSNGGSGSYDASSCLAETGLTGIVPVEKVVEKEWSLTGGLKGLTGGFQWDISTTYSGARNDIWTLESANRQLYLDTGASPRDFYAGAFKFIQWTSTFDATRELDIGSARPVTLAIGGEYRAERYAIFAGEPDSYYGDGAQGFAGYKPSDADSYGRQSVSAYFNAILQPARAWTVDLAVRYEHYSNFGDTLIGKVATRYDFGDGIAVRGTVSTGFRAPTMQESYYSAANANPTGVIAQLPPNSAGAAALGFSPLRPEKSRNFSTGLVLRPISRMLVTLDGYFIRIANRIVSTGQIRGLVGGVQQMGTVNGTTAYNAVLNAIKAQDIGTNSTMTLLAAQTFTNGIDSRTWGLDLSARYPLAMPLGSVEFGLSVNYGKTRVTANRTPYNLFDRVAESYLETAESRYKVIFSALLTSGRFSLNLLQSFRAKSSILVMPAVSGLGAYEATIKATPLTDVELRYAINDKISLSLGSNNIFNKKPEKTDLLPAEILARLPNGTSPYIDGTVTIGDRPIFGSYDLNGGLYYARLSLAL